MMRIVADRNMAEVAAHFDALGSVTLCAGRDIGSADVAQADILLVRSVTTVDRNLLEDSAVKFVGTATSGFDHVDRNYLTQAGIGFAHAPGSNANSVVEYVLSVIGWSDNHLEALLDGASVGIVGYGVVGKQLHSRLSALGINCVAYDPWLSKDEFEVLDELEAVLNCPVISLHAELTDRPPWPSRHLLSAEHLSGLPADCLLINAGRGPLIDNAVLLEVAAAKKGLQLALDVWEFEPQVNPELMARCLFATPHIAGYSYDGKVLATRMLLQAACAHMALQEVADAPQLATNVLQVPSDLRGPDLVRWLQLQSYDVRMDDQRMREELSDGFDHLRATYPMRRELAGMLAGNYFDLESSAQRIVAAMGIQAPNH